jgi:hypothetical protein
MSEQEKYVEAKAPEVLIVPMRLEGTAPLLINRMKDIERENIFRGKLGLPKLELGQINEDTYWRQALHYISRDPDVYGFPASGITSAVTKEAPRHEKSLSIAGTKGLARVEGYGEFQLVEIQGSEPRMFRNLVPNSRGQMVPCWRGIFDKWYIDVNWTLLHNDLSIDLLFGLAAKAGAIYGIGSWSPRFGRFRVVTI